MSRSGRSPEPRRHDVADHGRHATARSQPWARYANALHHLQVALAVASLVGLLHVSGQLAWLDAAMLRLAGAAHRTVMPVPPAATSGMPEVLLLSEAMYERDFQQRSPLDRARVAQLLEALFPAESKAPATLVIDLDLSDTGHDAAGQARLDGLLGRLVASGTRLVLPVPLWVTSAEASALKLRWIRDVACAWNLKGPGLVTFASPLVRTQGGLVLQYSPRELSLGVAATRPPGAETVCEQTPGTQAERLVMTGTAHVDDLKTRTAHAPAMRPFNAHFFAALDQHVHVLKTIDQPLDDPSPARRWAEGVVFLGGGYDHRDRFETPLTQDGVPIDGVTLHAATYFSTMAPVNDRLHLLAWLIDVAVGVGAGFLFARLWGARAQAAQRGAWTGYLGPKLLTLLTLAMALALAALAVQVAAQKAYPNNLWISPGPVVLGVFAKLLLTGLHAAAGHGGSSEHAQVAHDTHGKHRPAGPATGLGLAVWLDWLFVLVLVALCLYKLLTH